MAELRTHLQHARAESPEGPQSREFTVGDLIAGKYRLVRPIATGGMGTVWIAHNTALDVRVAIKLLRTDVSAPVASGRLLQEARAAARLGHPAIVRVFDFGQSQDDDPFIVMELLSGESLAHTLERRTRLNVQRALQTLLPIADALSVAHGKGIVHRDLKPENIFLHRTETGSTQPKVVDFGIARLGREPNKRLTQDGMVMGSPAYMSPEQARGQEDVDHRTDIWSFAVVLYETITGKLPFDGPNNFALLRQVVEHDPTPTIELGVGDNELWRILELALRKDRDERWQSMRAFGSALALWLISQGVRDDLCGASLKVTWLPSVERSSVPPPNAEPLTLAEREMQTIETASMVTRPQPFAKRKLWKAGVLGGVAALAVAGFLLTREYLGEPGLPSAHVSAATAVDEPASVPLPLPPKLADAPRAHEAAAAQPAQPAALVQPLPSASAPATAAAKAPSGRTASSPARAGAAAQQRARSAATAASELKLPY